jgi:hypothetical protein
MGMPSPTWIPLSNLVETSSTDVFGMGTDLDQFKTSKVVKTFKLVSIVLFALKIVGPF